MKKTLFVAIFAAVLTFPVAPIQAQTVDQNAQIQELKDTLIALLTQMLASLQAQLADLVAKQSQTEQALGAVSTKVDTVVQNTTQVFGSSPTVLPQPIASVAFVCENNQMKMTISVVGEYKQGLVRLSGPSNDGGNVGGGLFWGKSNEASPNTYVLRERPGHYDYKVWLSPTITDSMMLMATEVSASGTTDENICQ